MKDKNDIETVYVSDRCIILMWEESINEFNKFTDSEFKSLINKIKEIKKKNRGI